MKLILATLIAVACMMSTGCAFQRALSECEVPDVPVVPQADYHEVVMPVGNLSKAREACHKEAIIGCAEYTWAKGTIYYERGAMCVRNHERLHLLLGEWHYPGGNVPKPYAEEWMRQRRRELGIRSPYLLDRIAGRD